MIGQAAAEAKVGTQMGNFGQASEEARLICETIWSGDWARSARSTPARTGSR